MINSSMALEKLLQQYRFRRIQPYLIGDVIDFGGNDGELKKFVAGNYLVVNYDHSVMEGVRADTIACLAVIEHLEVDAVVTVFRKFKNILSNHGRIFLTTPAKAAKPVLELLAYAGLLDKKNLGEHKHYWSKKEIFELAEKTGFVVTKFRTFQFGFNQLAVLEHA